MILCSGARWWKTRSSTRSTRGPSRTPTATAIGDLAGITARLDYLELARRRRDLAGADLRLAARRLRLRRQRSHGDRPRVRHRRRLRRLIEAAHERGIRVLARSRRLPHLDRASLVPRAPRPLRLGRRTARRTTGSRPSAARPGRRDERTGRWYLHSFFPEQPDLDWRNPEVREAMAEVVRHWLDRGVDGFRIDAVDRLVKDAAFRDDPVGERAVPVARSPGGPAPRPDPLARRPRDRHARSRALREAAGDAPPGRRGLSARLAAASVPRAPRSRSSPSTCCTPLGRGRARGAAAGAAGGRAASPGSPPTTTSPGSRRAGGRRRCAAAAMLLLTLPGLRVRLPGRGDRDGRRARGDHRRSTASAATASATRCSGTARPRRVQPRPAVAAADRSRRRSVAAQRRDPARCSRCSAADRGPPRALGAARRRPAGRRAAQLSPRGAATGSCSTSARSRRPTARRAGADRCSTPAPDAAPRLDRGRAGAADLDG